nr:hypothetical protein [Tanacetum cinerariifolium]
EEQPLPATVSPTVDSSGYITKSDPEEDSEEKDDEDPEEDPTNYPIDKDDNDEEEESPGGDADDEVEDEGEDEEEEEHLASTDSVPPPAYRTSVRMSIRAQTHVSFPSEAEVDKLLAILTPPPSPLIPLLSSLPRIPSPPLPVPSPPTTNPTYTKAPLGYRAARIQNNNLNGDGSQGSRSGITRPVRPTCECTYTDFLRYQPINFKGTKGVVSELALLYGRMFLEESDKIEKYVGGSPRADDHEHLMLPEMQEDPYVEVALQAPPSPNYVPGPEHADDEIVAEDHPYAEDASPIAQSEDDDDEDPEEDPVDYPADGGDDGDDEEESSEDNEEDEEDEMDVEADDDEEEEEHPAPVDSVVVAPTAADQDTDEIYTRLDDEQTERQLLAGRLNMLFRDRRTHAYARQLMETEARMSREAWVRATDASDLVHGEVMSLRTTVLGQMSGIRELQAADRRRDSRDLLEIIHSRSYQRRLVVVHRLDLFFLWLDILYQPTKFYGFYPG